MRLSIIAAGILLTASVLSGASIEPVGVIGNSGEAGASLLRISKWRFDQSATGVAMDRDGTLWVSGGDALHRVGLNGWLIERIPLEPQGSFVNSRTFAVLKETLYFFAVTPDRQTRLFSVPIAPMAMKRVARPVAVTLPERRRDFIPYCLAPQPLKGQLVLACEPKEMPQGIGVYFLTPSANGQSATLRLAFTVAGDSPNGIAVDEQREVIYLGGYFNWFVGGETHPYVYAIAAFKPNGRMLEGFPVACPKTPAIPTQFRGVISLAGGALWDSAWYGFLARLDRNGQGAPGRLIEWHHELAYSSQVLMVGSNKGGQLLAITTATPNPVYLARWAEDSQRLIFIRRIGCLPTITSVGLSEDGWIMVGTTRLRLWWRWEDEASAPPHKAEGGTAITPPFFHDNQCFYFAIGHLDELEKRAPGVAVSNPKPSSGNYAVWWSSESVPIRRPVGLAVQRLPDQPTGWGWLFVTDQETKQIWRTRFNISGLRPDMSGWKPLNLSDETLKAPTDIFAFTDGRLLVADEGQLVLFAPEKEGYRKVQVFDGWGTKPDQKFGKRLRFAVDGAWLLVSDTDRHRIIWLDLEKWKVLGIFGETDREGDDLWHLHSPTFVALRGTKALVADSGNQRVLKLQLTP
jgi:hypothetical protein